MLDQPQTILLTGGTSGIGHALLKQLLPHGHRIIIVARQEQKITDLVSNHANLFGYPCDLASLQQIEAMTRRLAMEHPGLSLVINNAAIQSTPCFLDDDFSFNTIEHETRVNFLAPAWITALLLPTLNHQQHRCAIVNISSGLALAPKTNSAIYCATKAALHSLSQSLRYQLEGTNIHLHEAFLPLIDTPMTAGRDSNKLSADEAARQIIKGISQGRKEIYIGKAKLLPPLLRMAPGIVKQILRRY